MDSFSNNNSSYGNDSYSQGGMGREENFGSSRREDFGSSGGMDMDNDRMPGMASRNSNFSGGEYGSSGRDSFERSGRNENSYGSSGREENFGSSGREDYGSSSGREEFGRQEGGFGGAGSEFGGSSHNNEYSSSSGGYGGSHQKESMTDKIIDKAAQYAKKEF